jgi:AhpD family alkylhydroperoxidase
MTNQSRLPNPVKLVPEIGAATGALFKVTGNGTVPQTTISLVQLRAGQIVGNTYLTVLHTDSLRKAGESDERITGVATWQDAPYFTQAERVALALVEAVRFRRVVRRGVQAVRRQGARHPRGGDRPGWLLHPPRRHRQAAPRPVARGAVAGLSRLR